METNIFDKLFIFEMANNHMGDVGHGLKIIEELSKVSKTFPFKFAVKFQYRDLDSFIHPDFKGRQDIKYVKRFSETRLSEDEFLQMKKKLDESGFISVCTPFDEASVDLVVKHNYSIVKVASCSFTDWPLLEKIAGTDKPLIASTAGAGLEDIDKVVTFFEHRNKKLCLMHCVGSYPTPDAQLELNQIDFFRQRYGQIPVGFSTHEFPDNTNAVKMAVAKGACVFERHVGLETAKYPLNAYSSSPQQIQDWLGAAKEAYEMCGVSGERRPVSEKEASDLRGLKRGAFCNRKILKGEKILKEDVFFAIPNTNGQILANDFSKYITFIAGQDIDELKPLLSEQLSMVNNRRKVLEIIKSVCSLLKASGIYLPDKLELEISHHYGIDNFSRHGCCIISCVNREYCKKIILLLPGQENPCHTHKIKEETFHILYGSMNINIDGEDKEYSAGDIVTVERNKKHSFSSKTGAVMEEISTTHYKNDSYYEDETIVETADRKTYMTFRSDWLSKGIA
ncbi:MAG: N-acetylneuraminate synthase family protein [Victivallaceae bacterium]|nr:N-acetylneuraminate synthase family protein [Victivallaceae bacterium]